MYLREVTTFSIIASKWDPLATLKNSYQGAYLFQHSIPQNLQAALQMDFSTYLY